MPGHDVYGGTMSNDEYGSLLALSETPMTVRVMSEIGTEVAVYTDIRMVTLDTDDIFYLTPMDGSRPHAYPKTNFSIDYPKQED